MPEVVDTCPVCAGRSFSVVEQLPDERLRMTYEACEGCGLVLMNPRPTADELSAYYRQEYWGERTSESYKQAHWAERKATDVAAQRRKQANRATHIGKLLRTMLSNAGHQVAGVRTLLEIGSSFGETLRHLGHLVESEGGRPQLFAIEPNDKAREAAADAYERIEVIGRDIADLRSESRTFDLILLSHVLEHLSQPVRALEGVRERLGERGLFYVEVPNYYGHPSVEFGHNFCFTPSSLRNTLTAAGFQVIEHAVTGYQEDFPFYVAALAAPAASGSQEVLPETVDVVRRGRASAMADFREMRRSSPRPAFLATQWRKH